MNLLTRELKSNLKPFLVWTICSVVITFISYWEYGLIDSSQLEAIFTGFPPIMSTLFGISSLGINDIIGYSALITYYVYFIGLFYALMFGAKLIQKEIDDQTSEFLFTKPYKRSKVLLIKVAVGKIYIFLFALINFGVSVGMMIQANDGVYTNNEIFKYMLLVHIGFYILMIVTFLITVAASLAFNNNRNALVCGGLFIGYAYMSGVATQVFDKLNDYQWISPWRYFSVDVIVNDGFSIVYLMICIGISIIAYIIALKAIAKKSF